MGTCEDPGKNRSSAPPCVSEGATKWGSSLDETGKNEAPCHSRRGTIKGLERRA
jgi:hypothetical protein